MRQLTIALVCVVLITFAEAAAQDDVADVASQRIELGEKRVYFLIGVEGKQEEQKRPLLLVLPGGSGAEDVNPFVKRIWKNALAKEFVVAQLVAVKSDDVRNTWPTTKFPHAKQKFSTESFIKDVVGDVGKRVKVDADRVYALGWSSSGPALYAIAGTEGSPIKGYFVAMSVFRGNMIEKPAALKVKRFYIFHSPEDQTCPIRMAREGKDYLAKAGAEAKLEEYAGGHRWIGDVYGNIREGVEWIEKPK
jgi:predicted esterase